MAPKKEQVFGGIGGIICISAIILAIVFGIYWDRAKNKVTCLKNCSKPLIGSDSLCTGTKAAGCVTTYNECSNKC
jgi:hypothetical protein